MTHPERSPSAYTYFPEGSRGDDEVAPVRPDTLRPPASVAARFLQDLALQTDGIGWVQTLECLRRRQVLARLAHANRAGMRVGDLAGEMRANLGYLAVVLRVLAAQGWLWRSSERTAEDTRVGWSVRGLELYALLEESDASAQVTAFLPVASHLLPYLRGELDPPADVPSLARLSGECRRGWGLREAKSEPRRAATRRLRAALDGNLVGPIAVALEELLRRGADSVAAANDGALVVGSTAFQTERLTAALDVLRHVGWLESSSRFALTELGRYAAPRTLAFGVPVSYLPLFNQIDPLLFGDAEQVWQRPAGQPEHLVQRPLNVRASGASHQRYFAAADAVVCAAFDRPFDEQPRGFCDMGSGDGAWLEHVWHLILERTERGRLLRAFPHDPRYVPLLIGADFNAAARSATAERLTAAGIPHRVLFGDINDPSGLAERLREHGIESRDLLHGNSFLVHNRPYTGVRDREAAAQRQGLSAGAYAWRGRAVGNAELEQNLIEFFGAWRRVLGRHGLIVIELHDPESIRVGKTLTNYVLTHGLSDQFCVSLRSFLGAAAEAGLEADPAHRQCYPESSALAAISISHFRVAAQASPNLP